MSERVECSGCKYWKAGNERSTWGQCRKNAPVPYTDKQPRSTPNAQWPTTKRDDWCGEAEAAIPAPDPSRSVKLEMVFDDGEGEATP
jgi:hypothetical protein